MSAQRVRCRLISNQWVTPTVVSVRFVAVKKIRFEPGQFLSVVVPLETLGASHPLKPKAADRRKALRRAYSFAAFPTKKEPKIYELCVKVLIGGPGSQYLASLGAGEEFEVMAPYGDFIFETPAERGVCFVATGTGIAPLRSMMQSPVFAARTPGSSLLLFGARAEDEILYPGEFEKAGFRVVHAISQVEESKVDSLPDSAFPGRVTDFLKTLPSEWPWARTDFYLCGNGKMVEEVRDFLVQERGVNLKHIFLEIYYSAAQLSSAPELPGIPEKKKRVA